MASTASPDNGEALARALSLDEKHTLELKDAQDKLVAAEKAAERAAEKAAKEVATFAEEEIQGLKKDLKDTQHALAKAKKEAKRVSLEVSSPVVDPTAGIGEETRALIKGLERERDEARKEVEVQREKKRRTSELAIAEVEKLEKRLAEAEEEQQGNGPEGVHAAELKDMQDKLAAGTAALMSTARASAARESELQTVRAEVKQISSKLKDAEAALERAELEIKSKDGELIGAGLQGLE